MSSQKSPLEDYRDEIEHLLKAEGKIPEEIATSLPLPTSARSVRRALRRWGLSPEPDTDTLEVREDEATIGLTNSREWKDSLNDTDALLRERGLDPDDWEVTDCSVSEWDSATTPGITNKRLKVQLKRKKMMRMVVPSRVELGKVFVHSVARDRQQDKPRLVVLAGDQQAPYHNEHLHSLFCAWLQANRPEQGVLLGDTIDLPVISRHPDEPDWAATTQECVDAAGQLLLDYVQSSEETAWTKLPGNHDERLRRAIINRLGDFYGLRPAQVESLPDHPPIHDPVHLLRLDELGIDYIRPKGSYEHGQFRVSKFLSARHGWLVRKGAGASAHATLDHLGHSVAVGHTHRQALVHQSKFNIDGKVVVNAAVETGCMCRIEEGLGYAVAPDWQNGFATATIWPDETFKLDLATYVDNTLYWRDQRYA